MYQKRITLFDIEKYHALSDFVFSRGVSILFRKTEFLISLTTIDPQMD